MKGNVVDLALGVIICAAFGKIASSLVGDVIMPPLGMTIGEINFSDLAVTVQQTQEFSGACRRCPSAPTASPEERFRGILLPRRRMPIYRQTR